MSTAPQELIVVRRLARSDLGLFAVHRDRIRSNQRAININAAIAQQLLNPEAFASGRVTLQCTCTHRGTVVRAPRLLGKSHKNWRLGGPRIAGNIFEQVRVGDFVLLRGAEGNDGSQPIALGFVTAAHDPVRHHGLAGLVNGALDEGMAAFPAGSKEFADYVHLCPREFIAVRSLAESDLGLFAEHRAALHCKQRAFNINAAIARQMMDPAVYDQGGKDFPVVLRHRSREVRSPRSFKKVGKNWRLGGRKIDGTEFAKLGCKDFLLIRSFQWNDGSYPIALTLLGKKIQQLEHIGLAKLLIDRFHQSMTVFSEGDPTFAHLAKYCPAP